MTSHSPIARRLALLLPLLIAAGCSKPATNEVPFNRFDAKAKEAFKETATNADVENWFTKSPDKDGVEGVSAERAYSELGLTAGQKIIVAVIDSGVDITHEDLKGKIWVNPGEIPANQIDDEKNGYIDDVNGWNFIGGYDAAGKPRNIATEQLEQTREVVRLKAKKAAAGGVLSSDDQMLLDKVTKDVADGRKESQDTVDQSNAVLAKLKVQYDILAAELGKKFEEVTANDVAMLKTADPALSAARAQLLALFKAGGLTSVAQVTGRIANAQSSLDKYLNENFLPRKDIVGDDPYNYADHAYGNNMVHVDGDEHGTHVSGIIAANRGNGIGIDGVAANAIIMPIRAVPDSDERDKDIANAIRYAVDNGARVINMSFGKKYSPGKDAVDAAMLYAEAHGVLLVHAAGNENADNDGGAGNFPNRHVALSPGRNVATWLEIGASSSLRGEQLPAAFSNYGQHDVDFFSPGVKIKSTTPNNTYSVFSGTSMASPVTAGVVALILGQKPDITAEQLRAQLRGSVRTYDGLVVRLPGSDPIQGVLFSRLSSTGGIVDAFRTLKAVLGL
jgi:cell wall-associated protease